MSIKIGDMYRSIKNPWVVLLIKDITDKSVYFYRYVHDQFHNEVLMDKHKFIDLTNRKGKLVVASRIKKKLGVL